MQLIAKQNGTGSSSTISFTSLSSYTHLYVLASGSLASTGIIEMRLNNDATSNAYYSIYGDGSIGQGTDGRGGLANSFPAMGNKVGVSIEWTMEFYLPDYRGTKYKNMHINSGHRQANQELMYGGGVYYSTNAINRLDFIANANFTTTTTFSVYGI
jgi:hypothetical protein